MSMRQLVVSLVLMVCPVAGASEVAVVQTDWSCGPGSAGPTPVWAGAFSASDDVAWASVPGQLALSTTPVTDAERIVLPGDALGAIKVFAGDLDLDGDTDVLGCAYYGNQLVAFYNDGGSPPSWQRQVIDGSFEEALAVAVADVDRDGRLDVLAGSAAGAEVMWWRNLGGSPAVWEGHLIADDVPGTHDVAGADLDGDGDIDAVAVSFEDDEILWWRNDGEDPPRWERLVVASEVDYPTKVSVADVDRDGDLDLFSVAWEGRQIAWWRNDGGDPIRWTGRVIGEHFVGAHWVHAADVDGDGWTDVLGAAMNLGQLAWWRNDGSDQSGWEKTVVTGSLPGAVSVIAGDIDGDGDQDVGGAGWSASGGMAWFENLDGNGAEWAEVKVDTEFGPSSSVHLADVDGNGSLDFLGSAWDHGELAWWRVGDFVEAGWLESSILDAGRAVDWVGCGWTASEPHNASLVVEVRASKDAQDLGRWMPVSPGPGCPGAPDGTRFLQYRVLVASSDPTVSPVLEEIRFVHEPMAAPAPRRASGRVIP
ncbi:MAG: VCBS repeat-containing protein [Thermoanaerobaculales bacterium]|jgi:hypothetical protein|nr:VCBS repeat-containing protein [Thermoanaerobaculales bacterium]